MGMKVGVVGGCGHVGLPLGIALTLAGADIHLIDLDAARVQAVRAGRMPFSERGAELALPAALATGRLRASGSLEAVRDCAVVIVTIGTPVDEFLDPSIRSFDRAIDVVLHQMSPGQLLVLRSTVFPGLTERLHRRVTESRLGINIAYCPERIAQGYALEELTHLPQIIGAVTPAAARRADDLFALLGVKRLHVPPTEAELAKLFANSYRYINFAISNQFYLIAQKFGCDFHRIHQVVTADYPRMAGFSRAGFAGGPCLLKDTMQLAAFNHNSFVIGQAAMMVNEGMPSALVDHLKTRYNLAGLTAAILGMAFKGNNDDPRDSLAYKLRKVLLLECRAVLCTDPFINDPDFVSLNTALTQADLIFIGACHDAYRDLAIRQPVVDLFNFRRGAFNAPLKAA
jgi:UDP-N-acetyl-D-mannosaminuronic acid dehydrogenase